MNKSSFKSEKVTKTAVIKLNGSIETIFPLFGAFEEWKWAEGWDPELIYPDTEIIEEGTTFKTEGRGEEHEFLWRVSKYYPDNHIIQYLVSTPNRYWTITVKCSEVNDNLTSAEVTYAFFGLNEKGNELNRKSLEIMYENDLRDWKEEINSYLKKRLTK